MSAAAPTYGFAWRGAMAHSHAGRLLRRLAVARLLEGLAAGSVLVALPFSVASCDRSGVFGTFSEPVLTGLLVSAFGIALAVGQWLAVVAARRIALERIALGGLLLFAISMSLLALTRDYSQIIALRVVQGLSAALAAPTSVALASALAPSHRRGAALGFYSSMKMLGISLGPALGGLSLMVLTPSQTYWLSSSLLIVASLPYVADYAVASLERREIPQQVVAVRPTSALVLAAFVASSCATSLLVLQNQLAQQFSGASSLGFGLAASGMLVARAVLNWPIGRWCDSRRPGVLAVIGLLVLGSATIASGLVEQFSALIIARVVMGIGMALFATPALVVAAARDGRGRCDSVGAIGAGFAAGVGVGPLVTGVLGAHLGSSATFVIWGTTAIALACAVLRSMRVGANASPAR
ncbi:MAG: MFS transporter [Planctomycetota bacterium]